MSHEVLPLEPLLRRAWNAERYLKGAASESNSGMPILLEDSSKAHVTRINGLMRSDYDWASIALISLLSTEAEIIGSWSEGCQCHDCDTSKVAKACPFRACRAPEMAVGRSLQVLSDLVVADKGTLLRYMSKAPSHQRTELLNSWTTASSRLVGLLVLSAKQ